MQSRHKFTQQYGFIIHKKIKYNLIFGHPFHMLKDKNISWKAKGYLSHLVFLYEEIDLPSSIISELIKLGYLQEAKDE